MFFTATADLFMKCPTAASARKKSNNQTFLYVQSLSSRKDSRILVNLHCKDLRAIDGKQRRCLIAAALLTEKPEAFFMLRAFLFYAQSCIGLLFWGWQII
jgi:hypothetical protein